MKLALISITTLFCLVGCGPRAPLPVVEVPKPIIIEQQVPTAPPPPPKQTLKLKEVKDTNYSDTYMYPEDSAAAKKDTVVEKENITPSNNTMTKEACISMISQEKFDKYTAMFGSEEASIKRCAMLKAMNK